MGLTRQSAPSREQLFWAFCRVLANQTRLCLLFEIIRHAPLSVAQLAAQTDMQTANTSMQLKELHTYGLIAPYRRKQSVYYAIRNLPPELYPQLLLPALIDAASLNTAPAEIIHLATAFTHQRRVEIVRLLSDKPQTTSDLLDCSNIKRSALSRHLAKLKRRGFVLQSDSGYRLVRQKNKLGAALLKAALH
jgi:DNA-binding MarR family transcriptional regulator